ncbi:unnamed protein product [Cylicostephanus goldi]|uniref:Uncharacterized protein n=1 Tax=Cylicostephanus goldi TaxID=71465 RepID=A0A3P7MP77_CYLGO|nr:unnamed protein product [Cylicostephanus goldi]
MEINGDSITALVVKKAMPHEEDFHPNSLVIILGGTMRAARMTIKRKISSSLLQNTASNQNATAVIKEAHIHHEGVEHTMMTVGTHY